MGRIRFTIRRGRVVQFVGLLVVALQVAGVAGMFSNPSGLAKLASRIAGERYPCESSACGCVSAAACWTTCRCQGVDEKLAWAAEHGVPVPAYADVTNGGGGCGTCAGGRAADAASGAGPVERSSAPSLVEAGCRGVQVLLACAVVTLRLAADAALLFEHGPTLEVRSFADAAPAGVPLGIDPPPPRV